MFKKFMRFFFFTKIIHKPVARLSYNVHARHFHESLTSVSQLSRNSHEIYLKVAFISLIESCVHIINLCCELVANQSLIVH